MVPLLSLPTPRLSPPLLASPSASRHFPASIRGKPANASPFPTPAPVASDAPARVSRVSCSIGSPTLDQPRFETQFSTLYELLGLEKDVGFAEIKSAYRQMARRYHPDVWPASHKQRSTELFLLVHEAYDTLSDPAKRASYDHQLSSYGDHRRVKPVAGGAPWPRSLWEAQLAALKHRRRSQMTGQSWGSRMRSRHPL